MDNGMDNMLDTYLFETNSLLEQLDELLIDAEKAGDFTTDNVNEIFRSMHTIKGSSAMMEFNSIMTIAHNIEDLFFYIRENGMDKLNNSQKQELFDLMFRSTDYLRSEVEKVENNQPLDINIDNFVNEINTFLNKISGNSSDAEKADSDGHADNAATVSNGCIYDFQCPYIIKVFFEEGIGMENLRAFMLVNALQESDIDCEYYPSDVESNASTITFIVENGFYFGFEDEKTEQQAVTLISNSSNIRSYELLQNTAPPKEKSSKSSDNEKSGNNKAAVLSKSENTSVKQAAAPSKQQIPVNHNGGNKQSLISVNLGKLDSLMAIVGEIVITESMVTSSPELKGLKLDSFLKSSRQLRKLTDDLQDIAMSLRMVPISGVFQKMNRIVRDMKRELNKDVKLVIIGEDTEVDKTIVDSINDPIMHIVRNAMDHGIEDSVDERIAADKPAQGTITLSAEHTGSEVIISINDDGRGMDTDAILAKASRNGLLSRPETEYTKKEILNMLMLPGFSTNETVTEFSGRGVGMDVVKKNVESVGGTVVITSDVGEGSCVTLKIPLTLAIVDGMEVSVGNSIFTIPIANIRQTFKIAEHDIIHDSDGNEIIERMGDFYPIIRLHKLYQIETEAQRMEDGILVWVESSDKSCCLFLDELLGEQQVVVKPLPGFLHNFDIKNSGISGCTIMGDGNISIILDIAAVYDVALRRY